MIVRPGWFVFLAVLPKQVRMAVGRGAVNGGAVVRWCGGAAARRCGGELVNCSGLTLTITITLTNHNPNPNHNLKKQNKKP